MGRREPQDGLTLTEGQARALELVVARSEGSALTLIVKSPYGDAAISRVTAKALFNKGLINITAGDKAAPTPAGRRVLAAHQRVQQRRAR